MANVHGFSRDPNPDSHGYFAHLAYGCVLSVPEEMLVILDFPCIIHEEHRYFKTVPTENNFHTNFDYE